MREMTRQPAEWIDRAPHKVRASREMIASPEEVWNVLIDHERWPEWFDAIGRAERTGGEGLGSTRSVWINKRRLDEEFNIWDDTRSFGFQVLGGEGPIPRFAESLDERVDIQVLSPERVRVTYLQGWLPRSPLSARILKLASKPITKSLRAGLAGLEQHIAAQRADT